MKTYGIRTIGQKRINNIIQLPPICLDILKISSVCVAKSPGQMETLFCKVMCPTKNTT